MLMKNNNILLYLILTFFILAQSLAADEFDISASNIKLFHDGEKILAEGNVIIAGEEITIVSESATYDKKENIIEAKKLNQNSLIDVSIYKFDENNEPQSRI